MTMEAEVLVVGGGATGVGVTRDLALRGVDVTLLERGDLPAGHLADLMDFSTAARGTPNLIPTEPKNVSKKTRYCVTL